jgi:hypothetical protein
MKEKMRLTELRVQSFVTQTGAADQATLRKHGDLLPMDPNISRLCTITCGISCMGSQGQNCTMNTDCIQPYPVGVAP